MVKSPRLATREVDLNEIETALAEFDGPLKNWDKTRLANRHGEWRSELAALREAIREEEKWTRGQIKDGESLREQGGLVIARKLDEAKTADWFAQVADYWARGRRHKGTDRVLGTALPYRVVHQIDRVEAVEREWRQFKDRLEVIRQEAIAATIAK